MPMYITLGNFTEQGIRTYKDTPKRAKAFREMVEQMGGKVKDTYWTMGAYDLVAITEAPDDETATAIALKVAALGNVRTTSLRGFSADEIEKIIKKTD
jgi:uncharacterized protein with GYD domain